MLHHAVSRGSAYNELQVRDGLSRKFPQAGPAVKVYDGSRILCFFSQSRDRHVVNAPLEIWFPFTALTTSITPSILTPRSLPLPSPLSHHSTPSPPIPLTFPAAHLSYSFCLPLLKSSSVYPWTSSCLQPRAHGSRSVTLQLRAHYISQSRPCRFTRASIFFEVPQ